MNYSVGHYLREAAGILDRSAGRALPIFVGGTGLYFKALTHGLSRIPPVPEAVREAVRRESAGLASAELHRLLSERDPGTARTLRPTDRLRVQRALEVHAASGQPLVAFHGERQPGPLAGRRLVQAVPGAGTGRAAPADRRPLRAA